MKRAILFCVAVGCGSTDAEVVATTSDVGAPAESACLLTGAPESAAALGCLADFQALSSTPIDATLPGARSTKVVLDQADNDALYFQNSQTYQIHYQFVSTHLSGGALPIVGQLAEFNEVEYYRPDRRFVLGAITHYESAGVWALELAPYDTADADMVTRLFEAVKAHAWFGAALAFHPTSEALGRLELGPAIPVVTTEAIYAGTDFQPLTLGTAMGRLHFVTAAALESEYLSYRDIVVLDEVPNDIDVVSGLITEAFQTPLSHINVLSQNRKTPNMGLRGATTNDALLALDGKWVELSVTATDWQIREVTQLEADAYWEAHRPEPVTLPALDLTVTDLEDIETLVPETPGVPLRDELMKAVRAFGGKAAHYSVLAKIEGLPVPKAFAIPVYYYDQFMRQNGLFDRVDALLADPAFTGDSEARDAALKTLRDDMMTAPLDPAFEAALRAKMESDYPGESLRFRTSTNSEDIAGFPCAGCYESHTGDPADWNDVLDAVRETWASIWLFRTFEERTYYGVDHTSVGMALLVHHNFPDEEANGVALTANPFDASGLEPGFYVNVQTGGDAEVVHPPAGVTSDEFLYFFSSPNQPITFLTHSSLLPEGQTVLTGAQTHALGVALSAIHERFSPAYGPEAGNDGWYAMDVEFKFDDLGAGGTPSLYVKQARPHPGRGE